VVQSVFTPVLGGRPVGPDGISWRSATKFRAPGLIGSPYLPAIQEIRRLYEEMVDEFAPLDQAVSDLKKRAGIAHLPADEDPTVLGRGAIVAAGTGFVAKWLRMKS